VLRDSFGLEVEVVQFVGRWLTIDPSDRSALGPSGPHNALGAGMMLGQRAWDVQGAFRLRVGPLTFERFLALSPEGGDFLALSEMTRLFVDGEFDFDVQLVLRAAEVPFCRLDAAPGAGARLGRTAWLKAGPMAVDVDDAVFPSVR
jgi:type VI secretion system protein ImpH